MRWFTKGFDDVGIDHLLKRVNDQQDAYAPVDLKLCLCCGSNHVYQLFQYDMNGQGYTGNRMFICGECSEVWCDIQKPR